MVGLTTDELASIRTDINDLLPDTGYIIDVTITNDKGMLSAESTSIAANGTVTYRLDPEVISTLRTSEEMAGGAIQPFHRFVLTLQHDAVITEEQRFLGASGDVYDVMSVDDDKS